MTTLNLVCIFVYMCIYSDKGMCMESEAALFKVLGEGTRLRLVVLLAKAGETCVCQLAQALGVQDFNISRHLSILRNAGLVEARRQGTWMYYRLAEPVNRLQECLYDCFRDCLSDHSVARDDWNRLQTAQCGSGGSASGHAQ